MTMEVSPAVQGMGHLLRRFQALLVQVEVKAQIAQVIDLGEVADAGWQVGEEQRRRSAGGKA